MISMLEFVPKKIKIHYLQIFFPVVLITSHFFSWIESIVTDWAVSRKRIGKHVPKRSRIGDHCYATVRVLWFTARSVTLTLESRYPRQRIVKTTVTNCTLHSNDFLKEKYAKWHHSRRCLILRPLNSYNQERAVEVITGSQRQKKRKKLEE
jgi:hypothetical protein